VYTLYILYTFVTIIVDMEYTTREFRDNLRTALDEAQEGNEVYIRRYDNVFVIKLSNNQKKLKQQLKETLELDTCKHGYAPVLCKYMECRR